MKFISKKFNAPPEEIQKELLAEIQLELENEENESKKIIMSELKDIKINYNFKNIYNLYKEVLALPKILSRAKYLFEYCKISNSKKRKVINQLIKKITDLKIFLSDEIPPILKIELQCSLNDIKVKMNNDATKDNKNEACSISCIEEKLAYFLDDCCRILQETPIDKGGRPNFSFQKRAIYFLARIYAEGTKKFPEHTWNRGEEKYEGDFQNFLLAVKPLLKLLKIDLGTENSIQTYASEVLSEKKDIIAQAANIATTE